MTALDVVTTPQSMVSPKSRQDFARGVYQGCMGNHHGPTRQGLSSLLSTRFAVLHAPFTFTLADRISEEQWRSEMGAAMVPQRIECMPHASADGAACRLNNAQTCGGCTIR